jgi:DNA-binding NarL/FixJ family response regulator
MMNILIADDHPLFRDALRLIVQDAEPHARIEDVSDIGGAKAFTQTYPETDLILLDLSMPDSEGFSGLLSLRSAAPDIPIVVISANEEPETLNRALACGASGFIPKSASRETIITGIKQVLSGEVFVSKPMQYEDTRAADEEDGLFKSLSTAEIRVLDLLNQGKLNKIIAHELEITESTVKSHISAILKKLGVQNRTQAVLMSKNFDFSYH